MAKTLIQRGANDGRKPNMLRCKSHTQIAHSQPSLATACCALERSRTQRRISQTHADPQNAREAFSYTCGETTKPEAMSAIRRAALVQVPLEGFGPGLQTRRPVSEGPGRTPAFLTRKASTPSKVGGSLGPDKKSHRSQFWSKALGCVCVWGVD